MDDSASFLSIAALAARIGVSESTIRNWRRAGRNAIVVKIGSDGVRRYPLGTFERIAVMRERGVALGNIEAALSTEDDTPLVEGSRVIELLEQIAQDVRRIADHLDPREDG